MHDVDIDGLIQQSKGVRKSPGTHKLEQLIDLSYAESALYLATFPMYLKKLGVLGDSKNPGVLNGGAARYNFYKSFDGQWFALGALEQKYYLAMLKALRLKVEDVLALSEKEQIDLLQTKFSQKSTADINEMVIFPKKISNNPDLMLTPVLSFENNDFLHEHNRPTMVKTKGENQPMPATRLGGCKVVRLHSERRFHEHPERESLTDQRSAQQRDLQNLSSIA